MVQFECITCNVSLEDQEMLKHLSQTRHKSIIHTPSKEQIECEKCHDSNIHTLNLIRYGGSDIVLLCQLCFSKEQDKPSTIYSLQNGSILRNHENYLRVRDLSCLLCGNESNLNTYSNNPNMVVCLKCIREKNLDQSNIVNENDDNFLYVLLGIKEHVKTTTQKSFKRTRAVGRGRGKKLGRGKKPTTNKVPRSTPSGNNETLRSFQSLSASEASKHRPVDERHLAIQNGVHKVSAYNRTSSSNKNKSSSISKNIPPTRFSKSTPHGSTPATTSYAKSQSKSKLKDSTKRSTKLPSTFKTSAPADLTKDLKNLKISNETRKSSTTRSKDSVATLESTYNSTSHSASKNVSISGIDPLPKKDTSSKSNLNSNPISKKVGVKQDRNNISSKDSKKDSKDNKPKRDTKKQTDFDKNSTFKNGSNNKNKKDDSKKKSAKKEKSSNSSTYNGSDLKNENEITSSEEYEEFEHVPKYLSNQPKLSYDSLNEYFKEMCFHLYLEEKLSTSPITNFSTEWHKDNKNLFKLVIPYTEEIENLVPEKLRKVGKLPFGINQSLFVARSTDRDNIWDCFVKDLNVKGRGSSKAIELLLELYKWNDAEKFPIGSRTLSIIPCSATISRILFSMARIENPKFINMLLGKTPIKQLNFKNRINFTNESFNLSQKSAIQHVLNNSITVLQGPPGTGKTSTIHEIILQLFRNLKTFPILVVAASNVAIDNIAEKLKKDVDLNVLRIVSNEKEREYNDKHHLADICLHHQAFEKLPLKNKDIALDLKFNRKPVSQNQYKKLLTVQNSINEKLIAQAQVILTTTVVAGGYQLKSISKLPVVIMDESTQSTEASTLIPLSMPGVDRFVFVGDDKQLSSFSDVPYLEQSMFERVLKNGTYTNPHMLNIQYRMHPDISEFPIKKFYNNLLENGVNDEQRRIDGIQPFVFVDYGPKYREEKVSNFRRGGGYTYTNKGEADIILRVLKQLIFVKKIDKRDISIITPYSAQRDLVATLIQRDTLINPNSEPIEEEIDEDSLTRKKPTTIKTIVNIMISSIDAFQGREKDIIIFSCVRSNEENKIGFVKDGRRLNVALTRARSGLVMIGNKDNMSKGDPLWADLSEHLNNKKFVKTEEEYFI